ncbi:MAG: phospholipase D family protein, partial [Bacillota bacterium]
VGSFNFDMRSCYLDTELMLAVDCSELNRELREYAGSGIDKSRHITADGLIGKGCRYEDIPLPKIKSALYAVLRYIIRPIRFLL